MENGEWRMENGEWRMENGEWRMQDREWGVESFQTEGMKENIIRDKSFAFALRVIKLVKLLQSDKKEFVLSKQILRSGTSIGALIRESEHAESKADFLRKVSIALKEANETLYWLELLHQSEYISTKSFESIQQNSDELVKLLVTIVKTTKAALKAQGKRPA